MKRIILYGAALVVLAGLILVSWSRLAEPNREPDERLQDVPTTENESSPELSSEMTDSPADLSSASELVQPADPSVSEEENPDVVRDVEWAEQRRARMATLIREDPEAALAEALTPREYASLPEPVQALVERPIATEDFYGVYAVCNHAPGEPHQACDIRREVVLGMGSFDSESFRAHIYGQRENEKTKEKDSLYGVVIDGEIALHEDQAVLVDDGPGAEEGRYAVYHRDDVHYFENFAEAEALRKQLNQ